MHEVAKVGSFSFSIIPSKEYPGLISFRMDWLDLLAVRRRINPGTMGTHFLSPMRTFPLHGWAKAFATNAPQGREWTLVPLFGKTTERQAQMTAEVPLVDVESSEPEDQSWKTPS